MPPFLVRDWAVFDGQSLARNDLEAMLRPQALHPAYAMHGYRAYLRVPKVINGRSAEQWFVADLKVCAGVICPYDQQVFNEVREPNVATIGYHTLQSKSTIRKLWYSFDVSNTILIGDDGALIEYQGNVSDEPANFVERFLRPASGAIAPDFSRTAATFYIDFRTGSCAYSRETARREPLSC
jgi:hypothetical protein